MSWEDTDTGRIKQIRQKSPLGGFTDPFPLGTDGYLVDMISGLDLEQQIKLGGNHYVNIYTDQDDNTYIKQWYLTKPKSEIPDNEFSANVKYSVLISMIATQESFLSFSQNESDGSFITKDTDGDFLVVKERTSSSEREKIEMKLYKNDVDDTENRVLLHNKIIYIQQTVTGQTIINEETK